MSIVIESLGIRAGDFHLESVSIRVESGGYAVLMGRTGCGKTTLLETVCGLNPATSGRIVLGGVDVTAAAPAARGVGYVPQDGVLFPTMTVKDHLRFAPRMHRWPKDETEARVAELAGALGIRELLDRKPKGLSGGERQRVALGRALAARPAVLCLDEPLSALDEHTRAEMYELLADVRRHTPVTTLHVTHSREEADRLADHVFRLEPTGLAEVARP